MSRHHYPERLSDAELDALLREVGEIRGLMLPTTPEAVARSEALPECEAPSWTRDPERFRKLLRREPPLEVRAPLPLGVTPPPLADAMRRLVERISEVGTTPDIVWAEGRWWCRHTSPVKGCRGCEADSSEGGR